MSEKHVHEPSEIDKFSNELVRTIAALNPMTATSIGIPGFDDVYGDFSPEGNEATHEAMKSAAEKLQTLTPVDHIDEVSKTDLAATLDLEIRTHEAGNYQHDLNVLASPAQDFRSVFDLMATEHEEDWSNISSRLNRIGEALEGYTQTLRLGIENKNTPAKRQVREVQKQVAEYAKADGFFRQFVQKSDDSLSPALKNDLNSHAKRAAEAYGKFHDFLRDELLSAAREKDAVGRDEYALASERFLGAKIDLDETYEWGKEELARMAAEQESIAQQIKSGATVQEAIAELDKDPQYKLHGTDALQRWMQQKSDQAIEELGQSHFDIAAPIRDLECMIAPTQEGGIYYTGPTEDFSRPGRMWWSVPKGVETFDTWRELTTVYHEGVPGHHLQIAQAVYNKKDLNDYRRLLAGTSGHAEGWALYAERLMDELGYLTTPADRLGMLDAQRMRAARVVLDIGVHLEKPRLDGTGVWDFDYALNFFRKHVNMDDASIVFEVNRYFGWPGQAPSYKVGQRLWEDLRADVKKREGSAYDEKRFHSNALNLGGVGLDTLKFALLGK